MGYRSLGGIAGLLADAMKRRLRLAVHLAMALVMLSAGAALAERRVALVVGNSDYEFAGTLANPKNDASDIAAELKTLGFDVTLGIDTTADQFADLLSDFGAKMPDTDVALFYYAGHGMQFNGQNYLLPVDAELRNQFSVRRETQPLDEIVAQMEGAHISLIFVDACRNNPLSDALKESLKSSNRAVVGRGLAPVERHGADTLIAFAAGPGEVAQDGDGRNSPFTQAMLKYLPEPLEISTLIKRVTLEVRSLTGGKQQPEQLAAMATEFYLTPPDAGPAADKPAPVRAVAAVTPDSANEALAFQGVMGVNTVEAWTAFLAMYPEGTFSGIAKAALTKLTDGGGAAGKETVVASVDPDAMVVSVVKPPDVVAGDTDSAADSKGKWSHPEGGDTSTETKVANTSPVTVFSAPASDADPEDCPDTGRLISKVLKISVCLDMAQWTKGDTTGAQEFVYFSKDGNSAMAVVTETAYANTANYGKGIIEFAARAGNVKAEDIKVFDEQTHSYAGQTWTSMRYQVKIGGTLIEYLNYRFSDPAFGSVQIIFWSLPEMAQQELKVAEQAMSTVEFTY